MFRFLRRRRRQSQSDAPSSSAESPIELYEKSGKSVHEAPSRTREILELAEQAHQDQQARHARPESESAPGMPVTGQDDVILSMLAGAKFGPNASVTLPSGKQLSAGEAQTWTELYRTTSGDSENRRGMHDE